MKNHTSYKLELFKPFFSNHPVPKQGSPLAPIWRKWSKPCHLGVEKTPLFCIANLKVWAEWWRGGRHRHLEVTQTSCTYRSEIQSFLRLPSRKGNRLPAVHCENSALSLWLQSVNSLCLPGKKLKHTVPGAMEERQLRATPKAVNMADVMGGCKDWGLAICLNMRFTFCSLCCQFISAQKASHNSAVFRFKCGFCSLARTPRMFA